MSYRIGPRGKKDVSRRKTEREREREREEDERRNPESLPREEA